jgi:hypothetical protein
MPRATLELLEREAARAKRKGYSIITQINIIKTKLKASKK